MAKLKGRLVELYVGASTATKTKIGSLKGATLKVKGGTLDATTNDSEGFEEKLPGNVSWSVSGDALYVDDDAAQEDVLDGLLGQTTLYMEFYPVKGAAKRMYTGDVIITGYDQEHATDGVAAVKIEMEGAGKLTKGVQPGV